MKVIVVERVIDASIFEEMIGTPIAHYKFHTAGSHGYIISMLGFRTTQRDLFNGKYNTFKKLLSEASEIIVATDYSPQGEMLFYLMRDLLEIPITFSRMDTREIATNFHEAWHARKPEGKYLIPPVL